MDCIQSNVDQAQKWVNSFHYMLELLAKTWIDCVCAPDRSQSFTLQSGLMIAVSWWITENAAFTNIENPPQFTIVAYIDSVDNKKMHQVQI